jgi:putative MATE family efflux protein
MNISNQKYDLTQGGILDKLLLIALPMIGTQFMMMSYNLTDMFLLGRVGSDAVASSGIAGMYVWLASGFLLIGKVGAEIGVSQNMGRHDADEALLFSSNAVFLATVAGVACFVLGVTFQKGLIGFFGVREERVALDAQAYLSIVSAAAPFVFVCAAIAGTFNGAGNSRVPFFINSTGLVLNALLDPIFIFALDMGVRGAAIATAIAQVIVFAMSAAAIKLRKDRPFEHFVFFRRANMRLVSGILRWSAPIVVESVLFTFFTMFISRFVAEFGASAIAVYRVGSQIESLCWLIGIGFATAVTAFVGQNYGAGRWDRIRGGLRVAAVFAAIWGALVMLMMRTVGGALFGFFLPDPPLIDMGVVFLRILALCQIFGCLESIASGAFRGLGITLPPSIVSVTSNALRVPLAYLLSRAGMGLDGIWTGVTIGASFRGLWIFLWFLKELRARPK